MATDPEDLRVAVEQPGAWARRLTITVPAERVQRERREVARRLARRLKLPGFRKGKIPTQVLERQYGPAIENEAVERVVGEAYREALVREGLQPISQGAVEDVEYKPGTDLTFRVEFEVRPEIELTRLGGFRITRDRVSVSEEAVDSVLEGLRKQTAVWHPVEDPPAAGDVAVVELMPVAPAGEERKPATPRRYELVVGEGEAAAELEAVITGLRPGEEADAVLPAEAERPERRVHVRLVEARRPELPELDDEFARSVGEFEDRAALRARVRQDLEQEAEEEAERGVRRQLLDRILEANPIEVPRSMVQSYLDSVLPVDRDADPEKVAEMRQAAWPAAEQGLRRMLVIRRVAEMEGLEATSSEVDARVEALAARRGRPAAEVRGQLRKSGRLGALEEEITEAKVFDFLKSLSTIE